MQGRKNTPFNVTLLGVTLLLCVFCSSPVSHAASWHSFFAPRMYCHFFHANIFHWLGNALCIYIMRPSPLQMIRAYPLAVLSTFFAVSPTVGLSGILYAYMGLNILGWNVPKRDWTVFIVANLITLFIPGIAFGMHAAAFFLGMSVYIFHKSLDKIL